jgi:hypothetical protein
MAQHGRYLFSYTVKDDDLLQRIVRALVGEEYHFHDFEVWRGEGTIRIDEYGSKCVKRMLTEAGVPPAEARPDAP